MGIMSQVVKIATLKRMEKGNKSPAGMGDPATLNNMLLKINCKLEGVNNKVINCHGWRKFTDVKAPTLFLGVDAIHPSRDEDMPSIAAVTANLDVEVTRFRGWFDVFPFDKDGHRKLPQLSLMFESALDAFYKVNSCCFLLSFYVFLVQPQKAPGHIVVLRDGVSDSEISHMSEMELGQLGYACRRFIDFYKLPNYQPTISYLVVQKKHGTRFWHTEREQQGGRHTSDRFRPNGNVPSGTVVDTVITGALSRTPNGQLHNAQDFFLCSQEGRLGTSRPAHYTMVEPLQYDTWKLTADEWQSCMYGLCHLVGRSKAVVSIPAPVYYADLLCNRVRKYVHTYSREDRDDFDTIVIQKRLQSSMYWT